MRRLFLKIFLWYWLATSVIAVVLVASTWPIGVEHEQPLLFRDMGSLLDIFGATAANTYERDGRAGLAEFLDRVEADRSVRAFLFDESGRELSGRPVPGRVGERAARAVQGEQEDFDQTGRGRFGARTVTSASGRTYRIAAEFPGTRPPRHYPPALVLRVIAVMLTAGGVCYGLALYLTRPVDKLRRATRALAAGDLSTRVGPSLGSRRDELADLGRDFDHMAERIESYVEAERRLLRDVSHELRSPLARLGVALELVRQQSSPDAQPELDRIELEAARLNELVGRILMLTRLEGALPGEQGVVDLTLLVQEVAADADFEARAANRRVDVVEAEPCEIRADDMLVRSAVENVMRNAVRYTAEGTAVEAGLVVRGEDAGRHAIVRIRDRGPGVPDDALDRIFRPFFRLEDSRTRESGGTGLGLAIAERAIRHHGGSVTARNAPDGGLVVELRLPLDEAAN